MLKRLQNQQKGFTIIELLVVIVVIGILLALLIPNLFSAQARARDTDRKNDLKVIREQLETYYNDNGSYPEATADLVPSYMDAVPTDPQGAAAYTYTPTPAGCTTLAGDCVTYTLSASLENDNDADYPTYTVDSINQ